MGLQRQLASVFLNAIFDCKNNLSQADI